MGRPRVIRKASDKLDFGQGKLGEEGVTDYSSTYIHHRDFSRTKSMRPEPLRPRPTYPAMELETTNMKTFVKQDLGARMSLIKPVGNQIEQSSQFDSKTVYNEEYKRKFPELISQKRPKTQVDVERGPLAKFDDRTMSKEFFKDWLYRPPQRFGEIPSFTQKLLFPHPDGDIKKESLCSRTQLDFPHKVMRKPSMVKAAESNIKVGEGDQYHETTHRSNFKFFPVEERPKDYHRNKLPAKTLNKPKMNTCTKYQFDFEPKNNYPSPPKLSVPAPDTLEIKMNNRCSFDTEQRDKFHGWDVNLHRRPIPAKLRDNTQPSDEPMMTETTTSHDFCKKRIYPKQAGILQMPTAIVKMGRFQDSTTNRRSYQDWGTTRRLRHGDFHEACKELYNKKQASTPIPLETTTKATFGVKVGRPRTSMKPDFQTIDASLQHDFTTVTEMAYKYPPASAYELEDFEVKC